MATNAQPPASVTSNGTLTAADSLSTLLHQNLDHALTLKKNIEHILNNSQNAPTLQTTLVKPEIWEAVIRTYTTNILTHNLILESLEKHALKNRPEAWQDVKHMLKDAVEMVFCARRVHEHVMVEMLSSKREADELNELLQKVQVREERENLFGEQPTEPQGNPHSTPPSAPSNNKYKSPSVQEENEEEEAKSASFFIDLNPQPIPTTPVPNGSRIPPGPQTMTTSINTKAVPSLPNNGALGVSQTPAHAKSSKEKRKDKIATNKEGLTRRQQKKLARAVRRKQEPNKQSPPETDDSSSMLHPTLNHKVGQTPSNLSSKRKSDVSMLDADEDDADVSMQTNASKRARVSPPGDYIPLSTPSGGEFEDISSIVDAELTAREARQQREKLRDMGFLSTEKRKRQSGGRNEDFGVEVRDSYGNDGERPVKKPRRKKSKEDIGAEISEGDENGSLHSNRERMDSRQKKKLKKEVATGEGSG